MLGSIVVALVTVSLLFVGVYLGNSEDKAESVEGVESYNEGFFGSLDALVGGLEKSAERGEETKEDRYQEYLKVKDKADQATTRFQEAPRVYKAQPATPPKVELQTTLPGDNNTSISTPAPTPKPNIPNEEPSPSEDEDFSSDFEDFDFDFGDDF